MDHPLQRLGAVEMLLLPAPICQELTQLSETLGGERECLLEEEYIAGNRNAAYGLAVGSAAVPRQYGYLADTFLLFIV